MARDNCPWIKHQSFHAWWVWRILRSKWDEMVINLKAQERSDWYWSILESHPRALGSTSCATKNRKGVYCIGTVVGISKGFPGLCEDIEWDTVLYRPDFELCNLVIKLPGGDKPSAKILLPPHWLHRSSLAVIPGVCLDQKLTWGDTLEVRLVEILCYCPLTSQGCCSEPRFPTLWRYS